MNDRKMTIAKRLLTNSVYMPESGMRKSLTEALAKLSLANLTNLGIIMDIQANDASTTPAKPSAIRGRKPASSNSLTAECVAAGTDWPTQAELASIEKKMSEGV